MIQRLDEAFGQVSWHADTDGLRELVQTILSQHTTDINSHRAFHTLWQHYGTWEHIHALSHSELAHAIHSAGLAQRKAQYILAVLDVVATCDPPYSIEFLATYTPAAAMQWLTRIPGIGAKTAACVLMFAFGMPLIPVDTHVQRVCWRTGIVTSTTALQSQQFLEAHIPDVLKYRFHVHLIQLGRQICQARQPACQRCPLSDWCIKRGV